MLVDHQIIDERESGRLVIEPWDPSRVQPASVDLTLDRYFRAFNVTEELVLDVTRPVDNLMVAWEGDYMILPSQGFALASTVESVHIPDNMVGRVEGKSSLARLGLFVHVTAGFIDPGFQGCITLELFNGSPYPMKLAADMPICQISFDLSVPWFSMGQPTHPPAEKPYRGKYQNAPRGPQASQYWRNFK